MLFRDPKQPFDMKEVVARIIDDSDFLEFKLEYDDLTVCGWAKLVVCISVLLPIMVRLPSRSSESSSVYSLM